MGHKQTDASLGAELKADEITLTLSPEPNTSSYILMTCVLKDSVI